MPPQASTPASSVPMIDQTRSAPRPGGSRGGSDSLMGGRIYHRDPARFSSVTQGTRALTAKRISAAR